MQKHVLSGVILILGVACLTSCSTNRDQVEACSPDCENRVVSKRFSAPAYLATLRAAYVR